MGTDWKIRELMHPNLFVPSLLCVSGTVLPWRSMHHLYSCGATSNCKSNPTAQDLFSLFLDPLLWSRMAHISSNPAMLCPRFECQRSRAFDSNHVLDGKILRGNGWHWHKVSQHLLPLSSMPVLHLQKAWNCDSQCYLQDRAPKHLCGCNVQGTLTSHPPHPPPHHYDMRSICVGVTCKER